MYIYIYIYIIAKQIVYIYIGILWPGGASARERDIWI